MPVNKNAYARYRIIDDVLNYKKYADFHTLKEACERRLDTTVAERTLKKDLADMRLDFDAPIEYDNYRKAYFYSRSFTMQTTVPLASNDLAALQFAVSTLEQFPNLPILQDFRAAVEKIKKALQIKQLHQETARFIQFEQTPVYKGSQWLNLFVEAIRQRKKVTFAHQSFAKEQKQHQIHPYLLKEYRNRWYVIGFDESHQMIRIFGLDRIETPELLEVEFNPAKDFDSDDYFQHSIGITVLNQEKPQNIVLLFDKQQAKYIETQPIHDTQQAEMTEKGLRVTLRLLITYELIAEILRYGEQVKVLAPESLRQTILQRIEATKKNYEE